MLIVETFAIGPLKTNCYLYHNNTHAWIIDPGENSNFLTDLLFTKKLILKGILLTHGHFDHILGIKKLIKHYNDVEIMIHSLDADLIGEGGLKRLHSFLRQVDPALLEIVKEVEDDFPHPTHLLEDKEMIKGCDLLVLHTPGHTPGGVCFYSKKENILFSGDTLFKGTVGRSDLPGGNMEDLIDSIKRQLLFLPQGVIVYPGHGEKTTIGKELAYNPYLR
ncbi:MAG: MBL fold metallo-hydrolase [Spirochaetia bacterium]|nr:MBL fold metallo-hydrolase [Spirochaetia bacterium]